MQIADGGRRRLRDRISPPPETVGATTVKKSAGTSGCVDYPSTPSVSFCFPFRSRVHRRKLLLGPGAQAPHFCDVILYKLCFNCSHWRYAMPTNRQLDHSFPAVLDIFGNGLNLPAPLDIQWPKCFQLQGGFAPLTPYASEAEPPCYTLPLVGMGVKSAGTGGDGTKIPSPCTPLARTKLNTCIPIRPTVHCAQIALHEPCSWRTPVWAVPWNELTRVPNSSLVCFSSVRLIVMNDF